jgi:hypothetical protein
MKVLAPAATSLSNLLNSSDCGGFEISSLRHAHILLLRRLSVKRIRVQMPPADHHAPVQKVALLVIF